MIRYACRLPIAAMVLGLCLPATARALGRLALAPSASIGGGTWQSETDTVSGRPILLQIEGSSLAVYGLDDPVAPVPIGRLASSRSLARFFLHRHIAYVISSELNGVDDWLTLVDYSDPSAPKVIARKIFQSLQLALCFNGNYLYLAVGTEGLKVFDITDPTAMKDVTGWTNLVFPSGFALQGDRLYMTANDNGFFIFDVTNPTQPRKIGEYIDAALSPPRSIVVKDTFVLIDIPNGIRLVSVTDPLKPRLIRNVPLTGSASWFLVSGGRAYVVGQFNFVSILDISIPDSAKVIGTQRNGGEATHIALGGNYLYAASYARGIQIVSILDPASPSVVNTFPTSYYTSDFRQAGNTLYLGADRQGLQVYALDNPALPRRLGYLDTGVTADWLETFRDEIAVAGDVTGKLKVIDIRDKTAPKVTDSIALAPGRNIQGLGKVNDHLYVCTDQGLEIYRAAAGQPVAKVYADSVRADVHALEVKGNLALIARGSLGLQMADVSVPDKPAYLGRIDKLGSAIDGVVRFAWQGNIVYTQDSGKGLAIIDVSDPAKPVKVASLADPEFLPDLLIWKTHLLVRFSQADSYGLMVFDISDPLRPVREQVILLRDLGGDFQSMRTVGDRLYLSGSDNGLRIFDLSEETVTAQRERVPQGNPRQALSSGRFMQPAGGMRRMFDALGRLLAL